VSSEKQDLVLPLPLLVVFDPGSMAETVSNTGWQPALRTLCLCLRGWGVGVAAWVKTQCRLVKGTRTGKARPDVAALPIECV
jgi:hypothetical protein